jgi:hypothetical protein
MFGRSASGALKDVTDNDNDVIVIVTERFERRLSDETGKLRVEMATEFGKVRAETATEFGKVRAEMATEFGKVRAEIAAGFGGLRTELAQLRAEMIERNGDLLKWILVFGITQTAAIVGLIRLWR